MSRGSSSRQKKHTLQALFKDDDGAKKKEKKKTVHFILRWCLAAGQEPNPLSFSFFFRSFPFFFNIYLEGAKDARFAEASVTGQVAETPSENVQMPQDLSNIQKKKKINIFGKKSVSFFARARLLIRFGSFGQLNVDRK